MVENNKRKESLRISFLMVTIIPLILMALIIVSFASYRFTKSIETEVCQNMVNEASVLKNTFDKLYPGDYILVKSDKYVALKKGEEFLDIQEYLEHIKEDTGVDITIFYGDVRMITTLTDSEGKSLQGTTVNSAIKADVIDGDEANFYTSVKAGKKEYYAYYLPLHNSDESVVGMIAILKSSASVKQLVRESVYPIYIISGIVMVGAGLINVLYSQRIINNYESIKKYLVAIERDNYNVEMNYKLTCRRDELGEMANAAVSMRKAIKKLTEIDSLTGIFNRRYANKRLQNVIKNSDGNGTGFSVCIGDIDFFKKVNDTYGHDAGDIVLTNVAEELKKYMRVKGFVARWGGEEFLIVFEKNTLQEACKMLEDVKDKIKQIKFPFDEKLSVTMSFGVADGRSMDLEKTIKEADARLYYAKEHGRNLVVGSDDGK